MYQNTVDMTPSYSNLSVSGNGTDAIVSEGGNLARNATLVVPGTRPQGGLPYIWLGSVTVNTGYTLAVNPGVELRFAANFVLNVQSNASLLAEGTPTQPITFTANLTAPVPGSWAYLMFSSGSHVSLAHCDLAYAGQSGHPALYVDSSDVQISHCTFHDNLQDAVRVRGAGLAPTLADLTITGNGGRAVYQNTVDMTPSYNNLSVSGNGIDAIVSEGGNLTRNATLAVAGSVSGATLPYVWLGSVTVNSGSTLAVNPGVELRLPSNFVLYIQSSAALVAEGTPEQGITFTANLTDPLPGSWAYLMFSSGSHVSLAHCDLAYAGQSGHPALYVDSSDLQLEFCTIHDNLAEGLEVRYNARPLLRYNRINDNGYGLRNITPATLVDARENWWGDASGPFHATLNPGGLGDAVSDGVLFDPWLEPYAYYWFEPKTYLLHGPETLSWFEFAADEPAGQSVDIVAVTGGQSYSLGSSLPPVGALIWDTTTYPNGQHELRALFRNDEGQVIADVAKLVAVNNSTTVAWHGGRLAASETWVSGKVHVVEEELNIPASVTLTVQPGAIVKFEREVGITIEHGGVLDAPATVAAPVILTSLADDTAGGDTNMDGSSTLPRHGDWTGITLQGTGQANLTAFVQLRYGITTHSGILTASETWNGTFAHQITGDVTVPTGATLTVEPGAVIKLDLGKSLIVNAGGTLAAEGNVAQPVVFTSVRDDSVAGDTNRDGATTSPAPGNWYRIQVNGGIASLRYVQVRYGAGADAVNGALLRTDGAASLTVANSILSNGLYTGLLAWGGAVSLNNTLIVDNDRAISAHPGSTVQVRNCTVDDSRINLLIHGGTLHVANTLITNHLESGFQYDFGTIGELRYNDTWSQWTGAVNYRNMTNPTGTKGNLSVDPGYKDREGGNYRLRYVSPAVDAADGGLAPGTDFMGAPRYDDPRTANTGLPTALGAYADIGALEFVETAESNIDLIVAEVNGPMAAEAGELVVVNWTVVNSGVEVAVGPWHDRVELVHNPEAAPTILLAGEVLVGQGMSLGPGQRIRASAQVRTPGGVQGNYYWQVKTNSRGEIFEGKNGANNTAHSLAGVSLDVPELVIGAVPRARQFTAAGESHWFRFAPPTGQDVSVSLDRTRRDGATELYIGQGYMPTREHFDVKYVEWDSPDVSAVLPAFSTETCYVLAYAQSLPDGPDDLAISAKVLDFGLTSVGPDIIGNAGPVTLELSGGRLREDMLYEIVAPDGTVHSATQVRLVNSTLVYVTFAMSGCAEGIFDVRVRDQQAVSTLPDCLTVEAGGHPEVWAEITGYDVIRIGREYSYEFTWGNSGNVDASGLLAIAGLPAVATWNIVEPAAPVIKEETVDWHDIISPISLSEGLVLPFHQASVRPDGVYRVRLVIQVPQELGVDLQAVWVGYQ